ncbi:MAG: hypothetical protein GY801_43625 [bacterium]|nr:hypothetical protein [bacterium]
MSVRKWLIDDVVDRLGTRQEAEYTRAILRKKTPVCRQAASQVCGNRQPGSCGGYAGRGNDDGMLLDDSGLSVFFICSILNPLSCFFTSCFAALRGVPEKMSTGR